MITGLQGLRSGILDGFIVEVVDVDQHPDLEEQWGDKVPVLLDGEVEICHYFLDTERLSQHLADRQKPA